MSKRVAPKGRGISEVTARGIIHRAKAALSIKECPYRQGWVQWSVWVTAYRHKSFSNDRIYRALLKAGVPCNVSQNSSTDYPGLLPAKGSIHTRGKEDVPPRLDDRS